MGKEQPATQQPIVLQQQLLTIGFKVVKHQVKHKQFNCSSQVPPDPKQIS